MKPGWTTSEAHLTAITVVGSLVLSRIGVSDSCKDELLSKLGPYISMGLASLGYAISRGLAKLHHQPAPPPAAPPAVPAAPPAQPEPK